MHAMRYGPSVILLVTVVGTMLLGPSVVRGLMWTQDRAELTRVRQELADEPGLAELSAAFAKVSAVVEPSVVHVQLYAASVNPGGRGFFGGLDPMTPVGNGSGWVYRHTVRDGGDASKSGNYVITNAHVVVNAARVVVRFADGSEEVAHVVGTDPLTDVAVLRLDRDSLHPAAVHLEPVRKGQIVFAFGSPFQFDFSVSQGIVSATGRRLNFSPSDRDKYQDFIQTDAVINPGNSGGPLTDIYGRVVGMNTAIATSGPRTPGEPIGFQGIGLAIPAEMVVDVADKLIDTGEVRRGYLGVIIQDLSPEMAASFGYDGRGVLIEHPMGGGPGAAAGLEPGDIVTAVAGRQVDGIDALRQAVAMHEPGGEVDLSVFRRGETLTLTATLAELGGPTLLGDPGVEIGGSGLPGPLASFQPTRPFDTEGTLSQLGVQRLAGFTPRDAVRLGYPVAEGVMVLEVRPRSTARRRPRRPRLHHHRRRRHPRRHPPRPRPRPPRQGPHRPHPPHPPRLGLPSRGIPHPLRPAPGGGVVSGAVGQAYLPAAGVRCQDVAGKYACPTGEPRVLLR